MSRRRFLRKSRATNQFRSLLLEQLESRQLLAGDTSGGIDPKELIWPGDPRAAVELLVTDQFGYPISQVEKGSTFKLQGWVHQFSPGGETGTYAAFADIEFNPSLVSVTGEIRHGSALNQGDSGDISTGLLDEVGGHRDLENGPALTSGIPVAGVKLFEVTMSADSVGQVFFSANKADLPENEVVLVGITLNPSGKKEIKFSSIPPDFVPPDGMVVSNDENPVGDDVSYGEVVLEVVEPGNIELSPKQNLVNPFDTNEDGHVTPLDVLTVLVRLKCGDDEACDNVQPFYTDVNGDGQVTRMDVIAILNHDADPPTAGKDVYVARLGEPLVISAEDGVLINDFSSEDFEVTATLVDGPDGLSLSPDGSFVWQPPDEFVGDQVEFVYSASDGRRSVNAKAQIFVRDIDDEQVIVSLRAVDAEGMPITEVVPGDMFVLEAYVEDTRSRPQGVFAAYVDVEFDAELATVAGPFKHGTHFPNARHNGTEPGRLDEVGGMQRFDDYQVGGTLLFSIPLTADAEGVLTFTTNIADTFPDHYMLLLGIDHSIPAELIRFDSLSLNIIDKNRAPVAKADEYSTSPDVTLSIPAVRGLLANDQDVDGDALSASLIDDVEHGTLVLEADGSFSYTPAPGFTGTDTFTYVAHDGELDSHVTTVAIEVRAPGEPMVAFRLQVLNSEGQAVDEVTVGDEFELRIVTEDVRANPQGVFAAYLDVEYNASLVSATGEAAFGETYTAGRNITYATGLLDESGAFTSSVRPIGGGEFLLFSQRFIATSAGQVLFTSNAADRLPHHEVLVYGRDDGVDPDDIDFGEAVVNVPAAEIAFSSFSLRVVAEGELPLGAADLIVVDYEATGQTLNVLANDSDTVTEITAVAGSLGTVSIAADKKSLVYSAPEHFAGHDQFTYTVVDSQGNSEVIEVDVQVKSPFQNFALPADTDADGHVAPIDALYGVNELNRNGSRPLTDADRIGQGLSYYLDVSGDLFLAPIDVLIIINELNARSAVSEGESAEVVFIGPTVGNEVVSEQTPEPSRVLPELIDFESDDIARWASREHSISRTDRYFSHLAASAERILEEELLEDCELDEGH